jgi:uncharacterized protein
MPCLAPLGEPLVNGRHWTASEVTAAIEAAAGAGSRLARDDGPDRFDVLPLLVATDGAVNALGLDRRRFRPNILVGGVDGLAERVWPARQARIGEAIIGFKKLRGRCVMTTYDPDTLKHDPTVLRRIVQELGGQLALDTYVRNKPCFTQELPRKLLPTRTEEARRRRREML